MTAIPAHKTRAMFECMKFPEDPINDGATLGFIMFECGLEGIGTKIVKRFVRHVCVCVLYLFLTLFYFLDLNLKSLKMLKII